MRGAIVATDDLGETHLLDPVTGVRRPLLPVAMLLVVARVEGLQVHLRGGGGAPWTPWSQCSTEPRRCWRTCCPSQPRTSSSPRAERDRALLVLLKPPAWRSSPHGRWHSMRGWTDDGQAEPRQELAARTVAVPCTAGREERAVALPRTAGRSSRAAVGRDLIQGAAELAAHAPWQWSARLPHGGEARRQDGLQAGEGRRRGGAAPTPGSR